MDLNHGINSAWMSGPLRAISTPIMPNQDLGWGWGEEFSIFNIRDDLSICFVRYNNLICDIIHAGDVCEGVCNRKSAETKKNA